MYASSPRPQEGGALTDSPGRLPLSARVKAVVVNMALEKKSQALSTSGDGSWRKMEETFLKDPSSLCNRGDRSNSSRREAGWYQSVIRLCLEEWDCVQYVDVAERQYECARQERWCMIDLEVKSFLALCFSSTWSQGPPAAARACKFPKCWFGLSQISEGSELVGRS